MFFSSTTVQIPQEPELFRSHKKDVGSTAWDAAEAGPGADFFSGAM
jgi:hypothetical protein